MKNQKYIRIMYNPATGNYDWRVEVQLATGTIIPRSLGTGWKKGKSLISITASEAFDKTGIRDYIHN